MQFQKGDQNVEPAVSTAHYHSTHPRARVSEHNEETFVAREQRGLQPDPGRTGTTETSPYKDLRALDAEILSIGLPMLATLAADPIAGLVDSAYMGRAGSAQLAAVGVALSIFNTATKIFNVPLLAVTTSSVAKATGEAQQAAAAAAAAAEAEADGGGGSTAVSSGSSPVAAASAAAVAASAQAHAASSCISLAAIVGLAQAAALLAGGSALVRMWGVAAASPVHDPALRFLLVRAVGAPITILMLTLQGVYRGLQDTRTPFQATLVSNALNIALAPILIFGAHMGAPGAAAATVAAQAIPLALMGRELARRLPLFGAATTAGAAAADGGAARNGAWSGVISGGGHGRGESIASGKAASPAPASTVAVAAVPEPGAHAAGSGSVARGGLAAGLTSLADMLPLFRPTGFLMLRSACVTATYAVATTLVARSGAAVTASHQICFQLWLACSLLADALAVAAQSLMARDLGAGSARGARQVAARVSGLSLGLGLLLAAGLALAGQLLPRMFTSDPDVIRLVSGLFPLIAATQPITVLAMAWDGILYGAGGFRYAALSMALAALPAILLMQQGGGLYQQLSGSFAAVAAAAAGVAGAAAGTGAAVTAGAAATAGAGVSALSGEEHLWLVWAGLSVLMLLRWMTIAVPYTLRVGPFRKLSPGVVEKSGGFR